MTASAKSDTPSMEVIREPQTKEEWEQAYIAVLKRAHEAERELTAALADPVLRGWRPIESAPKERKTAVLISGGTFGWGDVVNNMDFVVIGHRVERKTYDDGGNGEFWYKPTHWMPLPEPPEGK